MLDALPRSAKLSMNSPRAIVQEKSGVGAWGDGLDTIAEPLGRLGNEVVLNQTVNVNPRGIFRLQYLSTGISSPRLAGQMP